MQEFNARYGRSIIWVPWQRPGFELGLMLKRADSSYLAGRPKGPWFKWKRDPMLADCVLMYAQRGHGKRSSFYSDFTFGCWRAASSGTAEGKRELAPVGKAYFGFTDEELRWLDKWVRDHTTNCFGPVREVVHGRPVKNTDALATPAALEEFRDRPELRS